MVNHIALCSGFFVFVCYTFLMVGTATNTWRKEIDGISYFDREYGLWELCFNGNDCDDVETYLLPGEDESALKATRAFALLAVIMGLVSVPCLCAVGLAGKCFCLEGGALRPLTCLSITFMQIFALIAFSVFVGKVQHQLELDSNIWEYGYSFALFTTGWTFACCFGAPVGVAKDED